MSPPKILIQLDSDPQCSTFDAVVAIDAGVEHLLQYGAVTEDSVTALIHGAMFTRSPGELNHTAVFVGGSNVSLGESIGQALQGQFFGPMSVSIMLDGNGANTTAAAAVLSAARHVRLDGLKAVVLGGTGPVGGRVARLLLRQGAEVSLVSRDSARAHSACRELLKRLDASAGERLAAVSPTDSDRWPDVLGRAEAIFGCGAAGAQLLDESQMKKARSAKIAIDLNAVPPAGLCGIEVTDKAVERGDRIDYGAIGVGGLKMKIHKAALQKLFSSNTLFLNTDEIYEVGLSLV